MKYRCTHCVCALGELFAPLLEEAGIKNDHVKAMDRDEVTDAMYACVETITPILEDQG